MKVVRLYYIFLRIGGVEEMMRIGLYMNDLGLHDTSREMVLSGIKPLPQLEMARDQVLELPEKYMIKLILVFR